MNATRTPHLASCYLAHLVSGVIPHTPCTCWADAVVSPLSQIGEESLRKTMAGSSEVSALELGCELGLCHVTDT